MTRKTKLQHRLYVMNACDVSRSWIKNRTIDQAWEQCNNPEWMRWLIARTVRGYFNNPINVSLVLNSDRHVVLDLYLYASADVLRKVFRSQIAQWARDTGLPVRSRAARWMVP